MKNTDYKEIAEHYQELSSIYQYRYEDMIKEMFVVCELQGVWLEIKSDCIKYTKKTGKSPEQAENRLKIIDEALRRFDYLLNEKHRQTEMIKIMVDKYTKLLEENKELKKQIEVNEKVWMEEN